MLKILFFVLAIRVGIIFCELPKKPTTSPCNLNDKKCMSDMTQWMFISAIHGNPGKGIESFDPLHVDVIEGNLGYVTYTVSKLSMGGFKSCKINETSLNTDMTSMHMFINCPRLHVIGDYVIDGKVVTYPIRGKGDYYADLTNYCFSLDTNVTFFKKNQKLYMEHETFTVKADLLGTLDFELRNLFDGNKKLSDPIHNFGKGNPRLFTSLLHDPIFDSLFKKIMKNFNNLYKETPISELYAVDEKKVKLVE